MRLEELEERGLVWSALPESRRRFLSDIHAAVAENPDSEQAVLDFIQSRQTSADVGEAVARFIAGKVSAAGELSPYLVTVKRNLKALADHFKGRSVADIQLPELSAWLEQRAKNRGWKLKRDVRGYLVEFWRWAQIEGIAGREAVSVASRLPRIGKEAMERHVLTPGELSRLLAAVGDEWRAWVVLGAFAGMRPEEICPSVSKRREKRGLHIEEIDWRFNVIRIPACVSKVGFPRNVPICDALKAGLHWAGIKEGMRGPVCKRNPSQAFELRRLGKEVFGNGWPKDALRHSFGSYRNAIVRSLEQVAQEMGTSVAMLQRHYHNPKAEEEGQQWFAVRPESDPIKSDENGLNITEEEIFSAKKPRKSKKRA